MERSFDVEGDSDNGHVQVRKPNDLVSSLVQKRTLNQSAIAVVDQKFLAVWPKQHAKLFLRVRSLTRLRSLKRQAFYYFYTMIFLEGS
jgi:hypothetical protein